MSKLKFDRVVVMFSIGFFIFAPIFIYLLNFRLRAEDLQNLKNITKTNPFHTTNPLNELEKNLEKTIKTQKDRSNISTNTSYSGPFLHFKLNIEGRVHDQSTQAFVGIAAGNQVVNNPNYILSFLVNVPITGEYSAISLTGIDIGAPYVAYVKGATQLTKAIPFTSQPTLNDLGTISLTSGDLNEDNIIDQNDVNLMIQQFGKTPNSANWQQYDDFNMDGIINNIDLSYIQQNLGKVGDSGPWISSPLKYAQPATNSATLGVSIEPDASKSSEPLSSTTGYWLWIPKY